MGKCSYDNHLFLRASNGNLNTPISFGEDYPLQGEDTSGLVWVSVGDLYLRGDYLRPPGKASRIATAGNIAGDLVQKPTPSIRDISRTYIDDPDFNSEPIFVHFERVNGKKGLVVYEGRHRSSGAEISGRQFILARYIGKGHPFYKAQHEPLNPLYNQASIIPLGRFVEMHCGDY